MSIPINGKTGLLCLIGSPVGHSGSPAMYNYCFEKHGLDLSYMAFDIKEDQVPDFIKAARLMNIRGFNVTMPCKMAVAGNVDCLSPASKITGACNTVVNENGILKGYITDGEGFVLNLKDNGVDIKDKSIVLAGAGGASSAIFAELALKGARSVHVYNRSDRGIRHMEDLIKKTFSSLGDTAPCSLELKALSLSDKKAFHNDISACDIFINGTSVGMNPNPDSSIVEDISCFHKDLVVSDIVYNPLETKLLRDAAAAGVAKTVPGDGMLLWQGYAAYKLYTGLEMPVHEYREHRDKL